MKDYGKMSDFEINKLIAVELAPNGYIGINESQRSDSEVVVKTENGEGCTKNSYADYCNNPSDAWPIIHGNDIMLNPNCADELWKAEQGFREKPSGFYDVATAHNKNPLRAAMIVFLMMRDEQCQKS